MPHLTILVTLLLITSNLVNSQTNKTVTVKFATSNFVNTTQGERKTFLPAQLQASQMFQKLMREKISGDGTMSVFNKNLNTKINVQMWIETDYGNITVSKKNVDMYCQDPDVKFFFGPGAADLATDLLTYAEGHPNCSKIINIGANGLRYDWYTDKKRTFSTPPLPESRWDPLLPYIRKYQLSQVTTIWSTNYFYSSVCTGLDEEKQRIYNFTLANNASYLYSASGMTQEGKVNITAAIEYFAHLNVSSDKKAILFCGNVDEGSYMLNYIKDKQYDFGLIALQPTQPQLRLLAANITDHVFFLDDFIPEVNRGVDEWFSNCTNFVQEFYRNGFDKYPGNANYSSGPSPQLYRVMYGYLLAVKTLQTTKSLEFSELLYTLSRMDISMIVGRMYFDSYHRPGIVSIVTQWVNKTALIISPPEFATAVEVIPKPRWDEREFHPEISTLEWAYTGVCFGLIALSVALGIAVWFYREHEIMKVFSILFIYGILLGSIFIYISVILSRYHVIDWRMCHASVWCLGIGFFLLFGCLFAKSFRVWQLWKANLSKQVSAVSDVKLILMILSLVSFEIILLVLYSSLGDVDRRLSLDESLYPARPFYTEESCYNNSSGTALLAIMAGYGGIVIIFGLFLAWRTRKVPFLAFNESKVILFSMYNVTFFALLAMIVILNESQMDQLLQYVLKCICFLLAALFTVIIYVGHKFWLILHGKNIKSKASTIVTQPNRFSSKSTTSSDIALGGFVTRQSYDALQEEVEEAKKQLNLLLSKVETLQLSNS